MQGASTDVVRRAIDTADALPGGNGFAGEVDGRLVRDVLGRYPLFSEEDDPTTWSHDPTDLESPNPVPAGCARTITDEIGDDGNDDERLWDLPSPEPFEGEADAVSAIREAIEGSLGDVSGDGLAVAFSGGVDSAVVASAFDCPLYVAGFRDSHDVEAARTAADLMDRDLRIVEVSHEDIERAVPEVARAIGRTNAMDVQIALPLYLTAERARADGYDRLAVGQGADELFGGYEKVARADHRVEAETVRGAARETIRTLAEQLPRDILTLRAAGVEPVAPLLDDRVVREALRLPGSMLVSDDVRKWTFRRSARAFVPDEIATRDKKAVQYGSLVARELDRLARQAGYKRRMDDHVTKYVRSRLESADQ
ncbi:asparagine synthetase B [Haladaptatus sp. AB643]|uniref:asparagine synthase C-terminal domain-containing protein n=1 Tax=Haladaptatus sp. AB643 TaxID=2934174 RepID=UPI00209C6461|nr:asparagine synthetase B [Haladaptatus sp. AB643]MCO8246198.1 asparagine synthetase B [Haladaptatus sp. AB643]